MNRDDGELPLPTDDADSDAQRPGELLTGRRVGDFVIEDLIGEGGFGAVYRARQESLARDVVIKALFREGRQSAEHFLHEAQLASRLDHPYAAHVYAFGVENDGLLWIAMELVRGTPLDKLVKEGGPIAPARSYKSNSILVASYVVKAQATLPT